MKQYLGLYLYESFVKTPKKGRSFEANRGTCLSLFFCSFFEGVKLACEQAPKWDIWGKENSVSAVKG